VAAGTTVAAFGIVIVANREDAGEMLLEADVGFLRDPGGVGVDSLEKILDFLLNLPVPVDNADVRTARRGYLLWLDLVWLDLVLHFRPHPTPSPNGYPAMSV
jgi:hypothetical protein